MEIEKRRKMKTALLAFVCLVTVAAFAAKRPDFAGSWEFNPGKSKNIGMMMQARMTRTIQQTDSALDETTHTTFQGNNQDMKTHFDFTGKPVNNDFPMTGPSVTVSKWDGDKLVTTWTSESAVAGGSKIVRIETLSLSPDGNTMTVESVRGSNAPVVMVFDKKR
jgi:hypothetical protein